MVYWYIGFSALTIMLASLAGAFFTWKVLGDWLAPRLRYMVALAAGVFTVIIFGLGEEALHEGISYEILIAFVIGALFLETLTRLVPKGTHHHHGPHPEHHHTPIDARRVMLGDAIHNVHDGLALVPAFLVSPVVGFGTAAGILLHEVVQEISEFFILREAGWSAKKALVWNFAVSATILAGIGLSLTLVEIEEIGHLLVPFAAGGFTYILLRDLLPSIISHAKHEKRALSYAFAFLIGFGIMPTVSLVAPHETHEEDPFPLPEGFWLV